MMTERLRYFISILGSIAVLAVLLRQMDKNKMVWAAQHLDFLVFGLVILLGVPFVLLKAFKWHKLLCVAVPGASYRLALRSFLLGMTVSLFTPGRLGELARVACFPGNRTSVLMLALVDKLVDVTVLMTLCALSLFTYSTMLGVASIIGTALLVVGFWTVPQWLKRWWPVRHAWTLLHAVPCHLRTLHVGLTVCCYVVMALQFHLLLSCMHSVPLWVSSSVLPPILPESMGVVVEESLKKSPLSYCHLRFRHACWRKKNV